MHEEQRIKDLERAVEGLTRLIYAQQLALGMIMERLNMPDPIDDLLGDCEAGGNA